MAEELQLRIHTDLCKATVEEHLKLNEKELKNKTKVPIINKIDNGSEKELPGMEKKIK